MIRWDNWCFRARATLWPRLWVSSRHACRTSTSMGSVFPSQSYDGFCCRASALRHRRCWFLLAPCLVSGLSALARLKRLEIHLHRSMSIPTQRDTDPPPPLERASLTSLTFLAFYGISKYLEGVVARIDFPSLTFVIIRFLNGFIFENLLQLYRLVGRMDALKSPNEVIVKPSQDNSSITFTQREERRLNPGELQRYSRLGNILHRPQLKRMWTLRNGWSFSGRSVACGTFVLRRSWYRMLRCRSEGSPRMLRRAFCLR